MRRDGNGLVIPKRQIRKRCVKVLCDILQIWISTPNPGKIESQICRISGAENVPAHERGFRRDTGSKTVPRRYSSGKAVDKHESSLISSAPARNKIGGSHI